MKLRRSYKTDGWLFGWRTGSNCQPNAALWADARARRFCKDQGRKAATAKQELRKITAARALIRRISGIKSSRISKDRCEATCQVKPKTTQEPILCPTTFLTTTNTTESIATAFSTAWSGPARACFGP